MEQSHCCHLLNKLPREIRDNIWSETVARDTDVIVACADERSARSCCVVEPALLVVCKQIRKEATPIFYGVNKFCIVIDHMQLQLPVQWLNSISTDKLTAMNSFTIQYYFGGDLVGDSMGGVKGLFYRTLGAFTEQLKQLNYRTEKFENFNVWNDVLPPCKITVGEWLKLPKALKQVVGLDTSIVSFLPQTKNPDHAVRKMWNEDARFYMDAILQDEEYILEHGMDAACDRSRERAGVSDSEDEWD